MKARTKTLVILLSTFLIGGVVGALITGTVFKQRQEQLYTLRQRFPRYMERVIQPTDSLQAEQIRAVLQEYGQRIGDLRRSYLREQALVIDTLRRRMRPLLTAEQVTRLEAFFSRDRREEWRRRRERHPPRHPEPPSRHPQPPPLP